jgi:hypothetical protein
MAAETNTINATSTNSEIYWNMLKDLNADVKLDLIAKLSNSLLKREVKKSKHDWTTLFAGKWQDTQTAEQQIADIRASRKVLHREIDL